MYHQSERSVPVNGCSLRRQLIILGNKAKRKMWSLGKAVDTEGAVLPAFEEEMAYD